MKKLFIFAALAAPLFFSCAKEIEPVQEQNPEDAPVAANVAFKASIEELGSPTKADINASNQLVWASGDQIGVYIPDWVDKNKSFTLVGAGGSTTGGFTYDGGEFSATTATVAYFPWNGTNTTTDNNVYEGTMYFKLPQGYYGYTSGKMLTPLVAKLSRTGEEYDNIEFKHVGAAVKVKINNLPAYSKSIGLSVDGKQIRGDWHINPANAGTDAISLDAAENTSLNDVWLNYDPTSTTREFTFLFPVPTLPASSQLSFIIYDKNDVKVWSAGARTKGDVALGRAEVLEMPALSITAYSGYDQKSAWGICGTHNSWAGDTPMVCEVDGNVHIANDITFEANAEFKIRKNGDWAQGEYGWSNLDGIDGFENAGGNIKVLNAGTYDVILNTDTHKIKIVASDLDYPDAGTMPHHTSIKKATNLGATETANCYVITAPGNYKIPAVKGNSATSVGTIDGVELLWETYNNGTSVTANSVIAAVDWDETENGYVYFKIPDPIQPGNALIAAKNGSDIIWSWHIWIPATAIEEVGSYEVSAKYLMDRNLGALRAAVAGSSIIDITSVGLFYQWGRKDPFVGPREINEGIYVSKATVAGTERTADKVQISLAESIAQPTFFARGLYSGDTQVNPDWCSDQNAEYWGDSGDKSIYDPCPAGYRVPKRDKEKLLWADTVPVEKYDYSADYYWFKVGDPAVVFPAAGWIDGGSLKSTCRFGIWNSHHDSWGPTDPAEPTYGYNSYAAYARRFYLDGGVKLKNSSVYKSLAYGVRCESISKAVPEPEVAPAAPATGITLDGDMSDWADGEAISNTGSIKEWKYSSDASNLYFYFKVAKSDIKDDAGSYNWKRYIYIALDTDNSTSTGSTYSGAGLSFPGCDALATLYPFRGTVPDGMTYPAGVEFVNGVDNQGDTQSPVGTSTGSHVTAYGYISGDYAYLEIGVPRAAIGSPAKGKMKVQFSYSWNLTGAQLIEIKQ